MRNPVASSELTKNNSVFDCQQFPKGSGLSAGSSGSSGPSPFQMQNKNSTNATITSAASFSADSKCSLVLLCLYVIIDTSRGWTGFALPGLSCLETRINGSVLMSRLST